MAAVGTLHTLCSMLYAIRTGFEKSGKRGRIEQSNLTLSSGLFIFVRFDELVQVPAISWSDIDELNTHPKIRVALVGLESS